MNSKHAAVCSSPEWASYLQEHVLEPLAGSVELGDNMLEFGPGPGGATSWLRHRIKSLTAVELEPEAARRLADQFADTNVSVVTGDCSRTSFPDESFDSVGSFTMLHHLPNQQLQFATLQEAFRVLKPGGVLVGSDSLASVELHAFHEDDTYNPIDPARLLVFLQACGFGRVSLVVDRRVLFTAHKPGVES